MDAISYTQARNSLSAVMARVTENHEPLIITPRKGKATVLMALEDFNSWQNELEDYELGKIVKARQAEKPFAIEVSLDDL